MAAHLLLLLLLGAEVYEVTPKGLLSAAIKWSERTTNEKQTMQRVVKILNQVSQGPARGKPLNLHLDPSLPGVDYILKQQHLNMPTYEGTPVHVVILNSKAADFISTYKFVSPPKNILLINLHSTASKTSLLNQSSWIDVVNLALLTPLPAEPTSLAVYTLRPFCSPSLHFLGHWSLKAFPTWRSLFPDRYPATCHAMFRIATSFMDEPCLYHNSHNQRKGLCLNIVEELATKINYSYTMTEKTVDGRWASKEGGKWVGLLGMLNSGEYDFVANSLFYLGEHIEDFDSSEPIIEEFVTVFLHNPMPLPEWMNLVQPFSLRVWGNLVAIFLLLCFFFLLQSYRRNQNGCRSIILPLFRVLVNQSAPYLPQPRSLMGLWLLTCLVITTAYTSKLVDIFTRPIYPKPITTLPQLTASNIRLAIPDHGGLVSSSLKKGESPMAQAIRTVTDVYPNEAQAVAALMAGTHGYMDSYIYAIITFTNNYKFSNWYQVKEPFMMGGIGWFFRKHTPWKYKFDIYIKRLVQAGIIYQWLKEELAALGVTEKSKVVTENHSSSGQPITTSHLHGIFWLMALAWGTSIIVFLLEIITKIIRRS